MTGAGQWTVSQHARKQARCRDVTHQELMQVVNDYENAYDQTNYGRHRQIRQRGQLSVAVDVADRVVITVLLRTPGRWNDGEARRRHLRTGASTLPSQHCQGAPNLVSASWGTHGGGSTSSLGE